jgi:hypothetical protein
MKDGIMNVGMSERTAQWWNGRNGNQNIIKLLTILKYQFPLWARVPVRVREHTLELRFSIDWAEMADRMVKWQTEWQNSGNGGRNGQMVGMVEWQEWRTEWSNGRQKWLHTYYLWYTPTTPTTTTTTTPFNLL